MENYSNIGIVENLRVGKYRYIVECMLLKMSFFFFQELSGMDFQIYKSLNSYKPIVSEADTKLWLRWG